jgi:hypothetical protein
MEQTKKSHFGLGFLIGFLSCFVVIGATIAIAGTVLYQQYEPEAAKKEESIFEDYTNAIVTPILLQKSGLSVTLDYKYVSWALATSDTTLYLHGKATVKSVSDLSDFSLEVTLGKDDLAAIDKNLRTNIDETLDLAPNYGAVGLYYITNGCAQKGVSFKSLVLGSTTWTLG